MAAWPSSVRRCVIHVARSTSRASSACPSARCACAKRTAPSPVCGVCPANQATISAEAMLSSICNSASARNPSNPGQSARRAMKSRYMAKVPSPARNRSHINVSVMTGPTPRAICKPTSQSVCAASIAATLLGSTDCAVAGSAAVAHATVRIRIFFRFTAHLFWCGRLACSATITTHKRDNGRKPDTVTGETKGL